MRVGGKIEGAELCQLFLHTAIEMWYKAEESIFETRLGWKTRCSGHENNIHVGKCCI